MPKENPGKLPPIGMIKSDYDVLEAQLRYHGSDVILAEIAVILKGFDSSGVFETAGQDKWRDVEKLASKIWKGRFG